MEDCRRKIGMIAKSISDEQLRNVEAGARKAYGGIWKVASATSSRKGMYFTLERGKNVVKQCIAISCEGEHWRGPSSIISMAEFDKKYNRKSKKPVTAKVKVEKFVIRKKRL